VKERKGLKPTHDQSITLCEQEEVNGRAMAALTRLIFSADVIAICESSQGSLRTAKASRVTVESLTALFSFRYHWDWCCLEPHRSARRKLDHASFCRAFTHLATLRNQLLFPYKMLVIGFHETGSVPLISNVFFPLLIRPCRHLLSCICLGYRIGSINLSPEAGGQTLVYLADQPEAPLPFGALPLAYVVFSFVVSRGR
jgi:hypothetical protein